jgi:drug/metabolite transporter (DMT)-like permease
MTKSLGIPAAADNNSVNVVSRAFWMSLVLVLVSALIGAAAGMVCGRVLGAASPRAISWLQIVGASMLLWGTLFVRGWEIQTYKGQTLVERVNRWIYRALYCVGTAMLVSSLTWPQV